MTVSPRPPERRPLQCMEVRGGNVAVEEALEAPGLQGWVYSRPYRSAEGGGDVHYLSLCQRGTISRLILADVSGHGASVSGIAASLRSLMEQNINVRDQTAMAGRLNREFGELSGMQRFATAVVATFLTMDQSLTVCNAGHPRPLWYRASDGEWGILDADPGDGGNLPWGLDDDTPYRQFSVLLGDGDLVIFYTDALTEAADGHGRQLGEPGLLELARGLDAGDLVAFGRDLVTAVERHRGGREAEDDVTVVTWRHEAESRPPG